MNKNQDKDSGKKGEYVPVDFVSESGKNPSEPREKQVNVSTISDTDAAQNVPLLQKDDSSATLRVVNEEEVKEVRLVADPVTDTAVEVTRLAVAEESKVEEERPARQAPKSELSEKTLMQEDLLHENPEGSWQTSKHGELKLTGWIFLLLIAILGAVIIGISLSLSGEEEEDLTHEIISSRLEQKEKDMENAKQMVTQLEDSLRNFFRANDEESLLRWVRDPERVQPYVADWYSRHPLQLARVTKMLGIKPLFISNKDLWQVSFENDNGEQRSVLMSFEGEQARVDWETLVCYQPLDWGDFVKNTPQGESFEFRVFCKPDPQGLYSFEYNDENKWHAYHLTAVKSDRSLIGYVSRNGELDKQLQARFKENQSRAIPVILKLVRPPNVRSPNSVEIEEIVSDSWLIVD